jgi:hypothetical protein
MSYSGISGDKTEQGNGNGDIWIVKTDSLGSILWQNSIGGSEGDGLFSIQQTSDGGYILGGISESNFSGDKSENNIGEDDYWIVKVDSFGNIQWQNTIGGSSEDVLNSIKQTVDGGFILGGWSISNISGDKTEDCIGGMDYWIIKTNSLGVIQWQNTIGGNNDDILQSVQQTVDGGFILLGYSSTNISGDKMENNNGIFDYWIVKTNSLGNIQWQKTIGGSQYDRGYCIKQTNSGEYILGGISDSNISGDKSENCLGYDDFWIIKLTDKYNLISGKLFADLNSNGMHDVGEPPIAAKKIIEQSTSRFTFSDQSGNYILLVDSGNFIVSPQSVNWFSPVHFNSFSYFHRN